MLASESSNKNHNIEPFLYFRTLESRTVQHTHSYFPNSREGFTHTRLFNSKKNEKIKK